MSILKNMEEKGLYRGVDDEKLVDWFLQSIKSDTFDASRNAILDSPILRNDWEKAADHLTRYLDSRPDLKHDSGPRERKVSEATTLRGGQGKYGGEKKVKKVFDEEDVQTIIDSWLCPSLNPRSLNRKSRKAFRVMCPNDRREARCRQLC